jgi:hypothetical protein
MRATVLALLCASMTVFAAAPASADPGADMAAMGQTFAAVHSFHADIVTANGTAMSMDLIQPDKIHMTMNGKMQIIKIAGDLWMNMGGQWQHMPMAGAMMQRPLDMARSAGVQGSIRTDYTITDEGPAMAGGVLARKYHLVNKTNGDVVDMWISKNLPIQVQVPAENGLTTIKYSEYNSVPDITAPM